MISDEEEEIDESTKITWKQIQEFRRERRGFISHQHLVKLISLTVWDCLDKKYVFCRPRPKSLPKLLSVSSVAPELVSQVDHFLRTQPWVGVIEKDFIIQHFCLIRSPSQKRESEEQEEWHLVLPSIQKKMLMPSEVGSSLQRSDNRTCVTFNWYGHEEACLLDLDIPRDHRGHSSESRIYLADLYENWEPDHFVGHQNLLEISDPFSTSQMCFLSRPSKSRDEGTK